MKTFLNYVGQFRIYSLVDLIILLLAINAPLKLFWGAVFLHLGFIAFLETRHSHSYRKPMPKWLWVLLTLIGVFLFQKVETIGFLLFSYLYTKKNHGIWGSLSSLTRGAQFFFLVGAIAGYETSLPLIALIVGFTRNFIGDLRDTSKDKKEGMRTLPVVIGLTKSVPHVHLLATIVSTSIWWFNGSLSLTLLLGAIVIEISTYYLTPR